MSRGNNLPFPYGSTYFGGRSDLISQTDGVNLEGSTYEIEDPNYGTNARVRLRVVRNMGSVRIKASHGVRFGATANWVGRKIRGYTASSGDLGLAVDDALTTSVAQYDLFYVVEQGPVLARAGTLVTGVTALTVNDVLSWGASGLLMPGAAGRHAYARGTETITGAVTGNRRTLVYAGSTFADTE